MQFLSFVCTTYDKNLPSEAIYLVADKTVLCDSSDHMPIVATASVAMAIVSPMTLASLFVSLIPIRTILETRTERNVSPLVDFIVSKFKARL